MIFPRVSELPQGRTALTPLILILGLLGLLFTIGTGSLPIVGRPVSLPVILLVAGAASAVVITFIRIEYGLLLLQLVAAAVPFSIGTGTQSVIVACLPLAAFLCAWWLVLVLRGTSVVRSPLTVPVVAFAVVAMLATLNSNASHDPLVVFPANWTQIQLGGLAVMVLSAGVLLVVMNSFRELRWIQWLVWAFLAVGAVAGVAQLITGGRTFGIDAGGLFSLWVVALALGQALFNARLPVWARIGLVALAALWTFQRFVIDNDWLSGWVPISVAILAVCLLRSRVLFAAALVGVLGIALAIGGTIYGSQVTGDYSYGNFLRLELWAQNLEVTRNHLLLGLGPAGYAPYYMNLFPDRAFSSHSNYLDIFSQTGLIGSFFFIWFIVAACRVGFQARKQWPTGFGAGFVNGALAAIPAMVIAMAMGDWLIPFVYNISIASFRYTIHSWLFLGALGSMQHIQQE